MNTNNDFINMFEQGPCDFIFLINKEELKKWLQLLVADTYVGSRSFAPADYDLESIAKTYFNYDLPYVSNFIVATKDSGKWKVVLTDSDMISSPQQSNSLKRLCGKVD